MGRTPRDVTEAELAVLQVLWDKGPATRRQLADVLYPGGAPAHYTTVQKLLERLQDKGHVSGTKDAGVWTFTAAVAREELISRRLQEVAEKLCGGSLTPLLMNLMRSQPVSAEELRELEDLIAELGRQPRGKKPRK